LLPARFIGTDSLHIDPPEVHLIFG
jgi:hypothetical protein